MLCIPTLYNLYLILAMFVNCHPYPQYSLLLPLSLSILYSLCIYWFPVGRVPQSQGAIVIFIYFTFTLLVLASPACTWVQKVWVPLPNNKFLSAMMMIVILSIQQPSPRPAILYFTYTPFARLSISFPDLVVMQLSTQKPAMVKSCIVQ